MKRLLFLLLPFLSFAQNYTIPEPNFRVNRTATLQLSTAWQTVDFNGTSIYNANTFGLDPATGNRFVYWDSTNKLIKFITDYPFNYSFTIYPETSANLITTRATLQFRYVVPNGISPGVDLITPFVDTATPYCDLGEVTILANGVKHTPISLPLSVTKELGAKGVRVEMRLSNSLITLGVCNLTNCALSVKP